MRIFVRFERVAVVLASVLPSSHWHGGFGFVVCDFRFCLDGLVLISAFSLLLGALDRGLRVGFFIVGADGVGGWF
ncbi:MAG TPA: hypothetical protein VGC74_02305 [Stenotrophomonas sp.]